MMYDIINAISKETGLKVNIKNAKRGAACNCICSVCRQPLEAIKGKKNKHHFRHAVDSNCKGMTPLHRNAQQAIEESSFLNTQKGNLSYSFLRLEQRIGRYYCDAAVLINQEFALVEVFVTNDDHPEKKAHYRNNSIPSIKWNISDLPHDTDVATLKALLNSSPDRFSFIYWKPEPTKAEEWWNSLGVFMIVVAFIFFLKSIFAHNARRRKLKKAYDYNYSTHWKIENKRYR